MNFWTELRRRSVIRVAAVYVIVAWLVAQVAVVLETSLGLPDLFDRIIITALMLGLPIALVLAWAFELTPEGVRHTSPAADGASAAPFARSDMVLIAVLFSLLAVSLYQVVRSQRTVQVAETDTFEAAITSEQTTGAASDDLSIAVLPFVNMSSDPEQEYFSDGLSEELLNVLARLPDLRVIARTSSFMFKGQNADVRDIGAQLGVAHVLGSVPIIRCLGIHARGER